MVHFEGEEEELNYNNSRAALLKPEAVDDKLRNELEVDWMVDPFKELPFKNYTFIPLSIRQKSTLGQYRLLHTFSYPYVERAVFHIILTEHSTV